jgi:adsorption protein B
MYFVNRIYGWEHALVSAPRMVVGSLVAFVATLRALRIFAGHLITGHPIGWDKTSHVFPTDDALLRGRRRLGEILVRWEAVTERQLDWALGEQQASEQPLGRILLSRGWLDEETLAEAIATQSELPRAVATGEALASHRALLPERLWVTLAAAPIGQAQDGAAVIGVARPLTEDQRRQVIDATGLAPLERIIRESEVAIALRAIRGVPPPGRRVPLLGEILIDQGHVSRDRFDAALSAYDPERDGLIGEHLIRTGVIDRTGLTEAIAAQRSIAAGIEP